MCHAMWHAAAAILPPCSKLTVCPCAGTLPFRRLPDVGSDHRPFQAQRREPRCEYHPCCTRRCCKEAGNTANMCYHAMHTLTGLEHTRCRCLSTGACLCSALRRCHNCMANIGRSGCGCTTLCAHMPCCRSRAKKASRSCLALTRSTTAPLASWSSVWAATPLRVRQSHAMLIAGQRLPVCATWPLGARRGGRPSPVCMHRGACGC